MPRVVEVKVGGECSDRWTHLFDKAASDVHCKTGTLRAKASGHVDAENKHYVSALRVSINSKQHRPAHVERFQLAVPRASCLCGSVAISSNRL